MTQDELLRVIVYHLITRKDNGTARVILGVKQFLEPEIDNKVAVIKSIFDGMPPNKAGIAPAWIEDYENWRDGI